MLSAIRLAIKDTLSDLCASKTDQKIISAPLRWKEADGLPMAIHMKKKENEDEYEKVVYAPHRAMGP